MEKRYPNLKQGGYTVEHTAGVDMGQVLVVRAGVRGSNDLISIGAAPNVAARLSDCREDAVSLVHHAAVFDKMAESSKISSDGRAMWERRSLTVKNKALTVYRSSWTWVVN